MLKYDKPLLELVKDRDIEFAKAKELQATADDDDKIEWAETEGKYDPQVAVKTVIIVKKGAVMTTESRYKPNFTCAALFRSLWIKLATSQVQAEDSGQLRADRDCVRLRRANPVAVLLLGLHLRLQLR